MQKYKDYLEKVYAIGAEKAERQARKTLRKVYKTAQRAVSHIPVNNKH